MQQTISGSVQSAGKQKAVNIIQSYSSFLLVITIAVVFSIINPKFISIGNLTNLSMQMVPTGIMAVGVLFVFISGGMDLSAGVGVSFAAVVIAEIWQNTQNVFLSVVIMFAFIAVLGMLNGFLISKQRINPVIATLIMMTVVQGATLIVTSITGEVVNVSNPVFIFISRGRILGIPFSIILLVIIYFLAYLILNHKKHGTYLLAIGNNEEAAVHAGISVTLYKYLPYLISSVCMGLTAIIICSRVMWISPGVGGTPLLLDAVAAAVIGGVSVSGGKGTVTGIVIGALAIAMINNIVNIIEIGPIWYNGFKGLIILLMMTLNRSIERKEN